MDSIESTIFNLRLLQSTCNGGRGIDCVNTIILFLEKGDVSKAKACAINEWDKIQSYHAVATYLYDALNLVTDIAYYV